MAYAVIRRVLTALQSPARPSGPPSPLSPLNPSPWIYREFELDRYNPAQRHEILKLIARQQVIGPADIVTAAERAERRFFQRQRDWLLVVIPTLALAAGLVTIAMVHRLHGSGGALDGSPASTLAKTSFYDPGPGRLDRLNQPPLGDIASTAAADRSAAQPAPTTPTVAAPMPKIPTQVAKQGPASEIQLGAFRDAAMAEAQWRLLTARLPPLRPLTKMVVRVAPKGRVVYRLRARGDAAAEVCSALIADNVECFVVAAVT